MEKIYELSGCKLSVIFKEKIIQIPDYDPLVKFLSKDIDTRSSVFVNAIKIDYLLFFNRELEITHDSIIIEIWGHVFASYFAKALKKLIKLNLVEEAADFIIKRSDTIDCGEADVDENRKFWDILANFKGMILTFLPKRIKV